MIYSVHLRGSQVLLLLLSFALGAGAVNPTAGFSRAPYVQMATPNSITVVWRTEGPVVPVVRFGKSPNQLDQQAGGPALVTRAALGTNGQAILPKWTALRTRGNLKLPRLHSAPVGTFQYEVKLTGLTPDTRYYYGVFNGDQRLTPAEESYHFTTHPVKGPARPMRFWVAGDGGTGGWAQAEVYQAMREFIEREKRPLDFYLHVGDMAYLTGRDVEFQSRFFESYEPTLRNTVCWPAMGNHEGATSKGSTGLGPYYDAYVMPTRAEAGGVASGTEAYYSFDYANVHFICLDSHDLDRRPAGAMAQWLRADLEKARADWLIAYWHHPPYTKGTHDSDKEKELAEMRYFIMPILESGGVDLVLTGHSHIYERSMLIDGAYGPHPKGVVTNVTNNADGAPKPTNEVNTGVSADNLVLDDGDGDPAGDGAYRKSAGLQPRQGTVQVVTGNAGQSLGRMGTMPIFRKVFVEYGSVIVDINGDTLTATMLNSKGEQRDNFSIVKRGKVVPIPLALPWRMGEYKKPAGEPQRYPATPVDYWAAIPQNAHWHYLAGDHPRRREWTKLGFDTKNWKIGPAGFGYGADGLKTELNDMEGNYSTIYLRREFKIEQADKVTELSLMIDYDDAFIAYLNGREVARAGVERSSGRNAQGVKFRNGVGFVYVPLKDVQKNLRNGVNLLAIEGHNFKTNKTDFVLDPYLIVED